MKGFSCAVAVLLAFAGLLAVSGPARAASDTGLWCGGMEHRYDMEGTTVDYTAYFLGGYTTARVEGDQYTGEYRFTYGMSDSFNHGLNNDSHAYYLDAGGTIKFLGPQALYLRLGAGANFWWGIEEIGYDTFTSTFFQARGGMGIGTAYQVGSMKVDASVDLFLALDFIGRNYDFLYPHLLEGLRTDFNASCAWDLGPNTALRVGWKYFIAGSESLFSMSYDAGLIQGWEGTLGLAWSF